MHSLAKDESFCQAILVRLAMPSVFEMTVIWPCQSPRLQEYLEGWNLQSGGDDMPKAFSLSY
jgi:hypothetical protein